MAFSVKTSFTAVDKITATVKKMGRGISSFSRKAGINIGKLSKKFERFDKRIGKSLKKVGKFAAIGGGLTLGLFLQQSATAALDFDKNISAAAAKFGVFDRKSETFVKLSTEARRLGTVTQFTAGQAAEGLKNLATAGFTANQSIAGLGKVLNFAVATQSDLGTASEVAAKTLAAFGLKSKDPLILDKNLGLVTDTLNKLITTTGFGNISEFLDVVAQSGSDARAAGVDIQTWGAVVGATVSEAVPASIAGTRFSNMLSFMAKNQKKFIKAGIPIADAQGNYRDFFDIMKDVDKATANLKGPGKAAVLFKLFGDRGRKLAATILDNGIPALEKFRHEISRSNGITKKMAEFMGGGLNGAWLALGSSIQEVSLSLAKNFEAEINNTIKSLTNIAIKSGNWIKENKSLLTVLFDVVKWSLALALAIKAVTFYIGVAKIAIAAYRFGLGFAALWSARAAAAASVNAASMAGLSVATGIATAATWLYAGALAVAQALNPFAWIIAAVLGIIAVIKYWDVISAAVVSFGKAAWVILKIIGKAFYDFLIFPVKFFAERWKGITDSFKKGGFIEGIKSMGKSLLSFVLAPIELILKALGKVPGLGFVGDAGKSIEGFRSGLDSGLLEYEQPKIPTPLLLAADAKNQPIDGGLSALGNFDIATPSVDVPSMDAPKINTPSIFINQTGSNSVIEAPQSKSVLPDISNTVTQEQVRNERIERTQKSQIGVTIKDETNRAEVDQKGTSIPINLMRTAGAF